jgi:arylsulfatase
MDQSVGRLVAALRERGVLDNTLILFMSDNGGNAESGPAGSLQGDPASAASRVFCGQSWATLQNTPLKRYKHFVHEGGIATPLIAHWPAGIASKNELRAQPGHLIDIMATCVDVSGTRYPKEHNGKPILPMAGRSLRPAFANQPIERDALFWEHERNSAVRAGDWKLVRSGHNHVNGISFPHWPRRDGRWALYNLKTDRTEMLDLAEEQPDLVKELVAKWEAWAERAQVDPCPGRDAARK